MVLSNDRDIHEGEGMMAAVTGGESEVVGAENGGHG